MVNQKKYPNREAILKCLFQSSGQTVSGVELSEATGISRVAVWKHIKALKESGVAIDSHPRGYILKDPANLLSPFCFDPTVGERIVHFQKVGSTMDTARTLAREGAPHLTCVVAENQTRSRGRLNREWISTRGGLWLSLILRPDIPPPMAWLYNFAASSCLSGVLNRLFDLNVRVKWPNDLLLEGRKLCGLLSEMETRSDMVNFLLLGIGLNVNNNVQSKGFQAISLKSALKKEVSRKEILQSFLVEFQEQTRKMDPKKVIALWKTRTSTIGTQVRIETRDKTFQGLARDVDEDGTLIIEDVDHKIRKVIYGDCFHI